VVALAVGTAVVKKKDVIYDLLPRAAFRTPFLAGSGDYQVNKV